MGCGEYMVKNRRISIVQSKGLWVASTQNMSRPAIVLLLQADAADIFNKCTWQLILLPVPFLTKH